MKKYLLIISSIAFLSAASLAFADFTPSAWKYMKPIVKSCVTCTGEEYTKIKVDGETSIAAQSTLADLRIIANGSEEVPYQLVVENETLRNEYAPSTMSDLSEKGGEVMFILDLGQSGFIHDHLRINSDSKNFKRTVRVYAADAHLSHSDTSWRLLTEKGYIYNFFDQTSGFNAGSGEVVYPPSTSRYLRVVIGRGEGEAVRVASAHVLRLSRKAGEEEVLSRSASITQNSTHKSTELTVDFLADGIPTHQITLEAPSSLNFNRRAVIQASSDGASWGVVGNGYVFSLQTPLFSGTQLTLPYQETHARYIRVVIFNEDDKEIPWSPQVTIQSVVRALVFNAKREYTYALYYGNAKASAPRYDFARYFQYIESGILPLGTLGVQSANPLYVAPPPPTVPYTESHANILNWVLVFLVVVIGVFAVLYLKKLKTPPVNSQ